MPRRRLLPCRRIRYLLSHAFITRHLPAFVLFASAFAGLPSGAADDLSDATGPANVVAARWSLLPGTVSGVATEPVADRGPFALVDCRVVTVTNGTMEGETVLIRDGLIAEVGIGLAPPADAERVDCGGASVYPGLIDSGTRLGLAEIGAVHETLDYNEVGDIIPQMDALTAVNPNSVLIPVTRVNGVTTVLTEPAGALLPGTAALVNLYGYTPAQMHLGGVKAVVMNFPVSAKMS